jgi:ABC-2 type transport system permease protein
MKWRRLRAVARKEFLHILRDPRSLVLALALPLIMLVLFGYALTLDVDRIPLAVFDLSRGPDSRELISRFEASRYFEVVDVVTDYAALERSVDAGRSLAALVIPRDFGRTLRRGTETRVQFIVDGSDSNTASIGLGYATAILSAYSSGYPGLRAGRTPPVPIAVETRIWYNSELKSKNYIVPGLVAVILMIIAALLTSLTIAREWEMGSMEQLLSTPVRPAELVLGKMSAYFALGVADTLLVIGAGVAVFDVPLRGNLLLLATSCLVFLVGALFWGILLSAAADSQLQAYQLGVVTSFLPAFLLSGFVFDIESMPLPVQLATYLVPARYFITLLRGIFLKGVGLEVLALELLLLTLFAGVVFLAATRKVKAKLA